MPTVMIDGVRIYYESYGEGYPLVLSHEFAGDHRSWDSQVRFFSTRYRVITYNARGYPPSGVPPHIEDYRQERSVADLNGLLQHLGIKEAHMCGLSMGGNVVLNFAISFPGIAKSIVVAGTGTGSTQPIQFRRNVVKLADQMEADGMSSMKDYVRGPARVQLLRKDPEAYRNFARQFLEHSAFGSSMTFRGVLARRPTIFELESKLSLLEMPTFIMVGDEDDPCLDPAIFMKRCIRKSGLLILPRSGHAINLEEPDLFNEAVSNFLTEVDNGMWHSRDSGNISGDLLAEKSPGNLDD